MGRWRGLLAAALLAAAGCAGITTNAAVAPGANLAKYHTYGWYTPPGGRVESPGEQEVRAALERALAQKGLVPATTAPPEFLVAYHARKQQQVDVMPGGYGWGYGFYGYPDVSTYTEGTLIVDFVDPQTNQVFWRGTASAILDHPNNPDLGKIDQAVAKLIEQYPATAAAATARPAM